MAHAQQRAELGEAASRSVVRVLRKQRVADGVVELTLGSVDGRRLPDWTPGSHIDVVLPAGTTAAGLTRQYSLCGDRWTPDTYTIMVRREEDSRGGSRTLHDEVPEGAMLEFGGPRNNFKLAPAEEYLFIAGGIGITPLMPMIDQAQRMGIAWRLLYLGRTRDRLPELAETVLREAVPGQVTVHASADSGRIDLDSWRPTDPGVRVFACGPTELLAHIEGWEAVPGGYGPRIERFSAQEQQGGVATEFEVVAQRSGVSTVVSTDESVVTALQRVGVRILTSCAQGVCGTCETDIVSGTPDHRDSVLDDAERAAASCLMPCVSRSLASQLVLDI